MEAARKGCLFWLLLVYTQHIPVENNFVGMNLIIQLKLVLLLQQLTIEKPI